MGIQSTQDVTREQVIRRLKEVAPVIISRDYRELESLGGSEDRSVEGMINDDDEQVLARRIMREDLLMWTDSMLENVMDSPFYRFSLFDNYLIREETA
jgi:hypothetical protein